eukprot:COSAG01_NODE_2535_length_7489_cov_14.116644_2_plen_170_part_00
MSGSYRCRRHHRQQQRLPLLPPLLDALNHQRAADQDAARTSQHCPVQHQPDRGGQTINPIRLVVRTHAIPLGVACPVGCGTFVHTIGDLARGACCGIPAIIEPAATHIIIFRITGGLAEVRLIWLRGVVERVGAWPHQLDSSVGAGTYIPRTASRPCRLTEGIVRAHRA